MGCDCRCLSFLETGNQKTLFVLSLILLVFGVFHFFFAEDPIIGYALGIIACFLAILGLFGAWRKDSKTLVIVCFRSSSHPSSIININLFLSSERIRDQSLFVATLSSSSLQAHLLSLTLPLWNSSWFSFASCWCWSWCHSPSKRWETKSASRVSSWECYPSSTM